MEGTGLTEKQCKNCSYHNFSPVGVFPSETCSIHYVKDFTRYCDDFTTSKWVKIKNKIGLI